MKTFTWLLAALSIVWGGYVHAQTLSESTYRRLTRIHEHIGEEQYAEAIDKLNKLLPATKYSPYETAMVYQTFGFIYAQQGQYGRAADYFRQAIELDALPEAQVENMKYALGQFQVAVEDYRAGARTLEEYFATAKNPIPTEARVLLATAYAQLKQYRKALPPLSQAIRESKEPKEMWYQLTLALHYELKDYPASAKTLMAMVRLFPVKEEYWKQLSGMLLELREDEEALAVLGLADRLDYIDDSKEIINLTNLYLYLDIPYKGARLLEGALERGAVEGNEKHFELLSNAWINARETDKAIDALARAVARTEDGEKVLRLAYLYVEQEDWEKVIPALDKARRLGVKKPGEAAMLQGIAAAELGRFEEALQAFAAAAKDESTREEALAWRQHALSMQAEQRMDEG